MLPISAVDGRDAPVVARAPARCRKGGHVGGPDAAAGSERELRHRQVPEPTSYAVWPATGTSSSTYRDRVESCCEARRRPPLRSSLRLLVLFVAGGADEPGRLHARC